MKKRFLWILCALLLVMPVHAADCHAEAWVVYHPGCDRVLCGKNENVPLPMASTTKIMTALLVLERCPLTEEVIIEPDCTGIEGSSLYLRAGERYTVDELLLGLMLSSGNDAAVALAKHTAGTEEAFVSAMNRRVGELGLENTHFSNPHGLPDEEHFSTALDLAKLMGEAMKNDGFRRLASTKRAVVHGVTIVNHNKLLGSCEGVNGGKTGYTRSAGRCLVSSCRRENLELVCVTLNDRQDWADHAALYDECFADYEGYRIERGTVLGGVPLIGSGGKVRAAAGESRELCIRRGSGVEIALLLPPFAFAPVRCGGDAGIAELCWDGGRSTLPLVWDVG